MRSSSSKRPTLAQVARLAQVSQQTVSRVVNHYPGVRPSTRERVQNAIDQLGYRSNIAARALVTNHSQLIGVIAVGSFLYGPTSTLASIDEAAREHGYMTLLATVRHHTQDGLENAIEQCLQRNVDGLILIASRERWVRYASELELDIPFIVVGPPPSDVEDLTSLGVNQTAGAKLAVQHLVGLGHRRIALLAGPGEWVDAQLRLSGAVTECYRNGITAEVFSGDWTAARGYQVGVEVAAREPAARPTAVFAANDHMALGFITALATKGLSVPKDVSVIGFDDVPEAEFYYPPLSTIRQDFRVLGERVMAALLDLLDGKTPDTTLVAPILKARASTAPLTVDEARVVPGA